MTASTDHSDSKRFDRPVPPFAGSAERFPRLPLESRAPGEYITGAFERRVKQRGRAANFLDQERGSCPITCQLNRSMQHHLI